MRSPEVGRVQEGRGIRMAQAAENGMDGRLQSQGLGVQTCSDLRGMWPGGGAMVEEFEAQVGRLPADEALTLALVWTLSINHATSVQQAVVRDLVDQRESAVRGRPMVEVPALSQGRVAPAARQVLTTGLARDVIQTVAPALADPHGREQVRKQAKIQELFEFVVEYLVDLRELGLTEADTVDPARMQLFKDNLMQSAQRLGVERLGALLSAGRRWRRHAQCYQISVSAPSPLQVSQFLQQVGTAAASVWQALRWFSEAFGCEFHLNHFLVKPYRLHGQAHTGQQAKELQPWEILNIVLLAKASGGTKLLLLCFMLQSAVSCIRFEHMQRSSYVETVDGALTFRCFQGKARRKGSRPAYSWITPALDFQSFRLGPTLEDFFRHEALPDAGFLWPAVQLNHEDLWQVHDCSPFAITRKLSRSRFLELLRGVLIEIGVNREEAGVAAYNCLRRFMPTLANCLNYDPQSMQAIGSWMEIPCHGGPMPAAKSARATMPMGLHYAGHKLARSGRVKAHALKCFMHLAKKKTATLPLSPVGLLPPNSWSWEEFAAVAATTNFEKLPDDEPPADEESHGLEVAEEAVLPLQDAGDGAEGLCSSPITPDGDVSSLDTSSSASDESAVGEELQGIVPPPEVTEVLQWFRQGKKAHIARAEDEGRLQPWCRDAAFSQDPAATGTGLFSLERDRVCQRCIGRMPRATYVALAEHCGWLH